MKYPLFLHSLPEIIFLMVFISALAILLYVFGKEMLVDKNDTSTEISGITSTQVTQYFIDNGYVVCNISQVQNENKWLGYLIKNGEYLIATAYTDGEFVERHVDSSQ